ncbi:MAG TPA: type II toxin-antitoxin system PemK/MazF family toxin [Pseudorhizobium sp.]|nr:type II toxin-antitoxin system PemK/MazF family toxin [Pseudorhizobium sp.]
MRRGDIVIVSTSGDYGKPRPAVVVQTNALPGDYPSIILCPITSDMSGLSFRIAVRPDRENGLKLQSQIMTDKIIGVPRGKIGKKIGRLGEDEMRDLNMALTFLLGLAASENP